MTGQRHCTIGIMSGTSLDAVDVVALESGGSFKAVAHSECAIPAHLKKTLTRLTTPDDGDPDQANTPVDLIE